jgi:Mrp family chromosome partitioning ATPase
MSRNFELLQQLEQEERSKLEVVPISRPPIAPEGPPSSGGNDHESDPQMHFPAEVCKLARRLFLMDSSGPRVVVFTSTERATGCSSMAARCAQALATQVRRSVCLVDANLPHPALHSYFEMENRHGLAEALSRSQSLAKCVTQATPRNLWLLTSGQGPANDGLSDFDSLRDCMRQLRQEFEYAVIDAPPWNLHSHAATLGSVADGIVLVLRANFSRREAARKLVAEIKAANIRMLGAVLNDRTFPIPQSIYDRL